MSWYRNLKIGAKLNLILSLLLIFLFMVAAILTYKREQKLVTKVAVDNAHSIAKQIIETRDYMSSVVRGEPEKNYALVPQVVATQVAKKITAGSRYYVRQVSLRYRNPENRPDQYETVQLEAFHKNEPKATYSVITSDNNTYFRYMLPMIAEKSCLECHGSYEKAPAFVRKRFPPGHYSYNYKVGEIIGAVSVSIPMEELNQAIGTNLKVDLVFRAVIFFIIIFIMGTMIRSAIINPVTMLSTTINRATRTGNFIPIPVKKTKDEIGQLMAAYNEMMEELGRKTMQSRESEQRYRKFIEMARSAVITFMEDGKIVISNQKAEELLGISRQELLGENIFEFITEGESLKEGIAGFLREGKGWGVGDTFRCRILTPHGKKSEIEMAVSVSQVDENQMFTAILRELREVS